jgi:hypothetical protein
MDYQPGDITPHGVKVVERIGRRGADGHVAYRVLCPCTAPMIVRSSRLATVRSCRACANRTRALQPRRMPRPKLRDLIAERDAAVARAEAAEAELARLRLLIGIENSALRG